MIKYIRFTLLIACILCNVSFAQVRLGNWKSHSSMYQAVGAVYDNSGNLWAATSGGVFRYAHDTKEITEYRNIDALRSLDASSIFFQSLNNSIYVGSNDGVINIYSLNTKEWQHLTDIQNQSSLPQKRVTSFASHGSRLFVGGEFGLLEYDSKNVPGDYVQQIGDFPRGTPITQIIIEKDTIWVATPIGVARAGLNVPSLRDPSVWKTITYANGLLENNCVGIAAFDGNAYIASQRSILRYNNGSFEILMNGNQKISSISVNGDGVYYTNEYFLASLTKGNIQLNLPAFPTGHTLAAFNGIEKRIIFIKDNALGIYSGDDSLELVKPATPASNQFSSLAVDKIGNVWCTTALQDVNSAGFEVLSSNGWKNYKYGDDPAIVTNSVYKVSLMNDGSVWLGTWGGGIIKATPNNTYATFVMYKDEVINGLPTANKFVVTGKADNDQNGTVWLTSFSPISGGNLLYAYTSKGLWYGFPNGAGSSREYKQVAIDFSGTKWMASDGAGLLAFNEKGTLDNVSDDVWKIISTNDVNILSNTQTALAVDKNGALWVGTPIGAAVIFNPGAILRNGTLAVQRPPALANLKINDILIDPQNNKWLATNSGVFVMSDDGTQLIATYTKDNTPLTTNEVLSIALNENDGTIYLGTKEGLLQAQSLSLLPSTAYNITAYPQPFYPDINDEVIIDGLASDANIRILTPGGQSIRSLQTKSRRAVWDGRDNFGNIVPTGVYIILSASSTGSQSGAGKIAVVRE